MAVTALLGALGFLSRLPVGRERAHWDAVTGAPAAFPIAGYALGGLVALPLLAPAPPATVAALFAVGIYAVAGVNHADGVTDLGDAAAVHGGVDERRAALKDTTVGAGGALVLALAVTGLAAAGFALAGLPVGAAIPIAVAAEVGAKAAMAGVVCVGTAAHEGLGSAFTDGADSRSLLPVGLAAAPAALLPWPRLAPGVAALLASSVVAAGTLRWADARLGGVSGDVLGATNELARLAALHAGVMAWTLS